MDKILTFIDRLAFREWLGRHGTESDGIWLLFSKTEDLVTLSEAESLQYCSRNHCISFLVFYNER